MADDLRRFLEGETVHARRGDAFYLARRWIHRHLLVAGISGTAVLLLLALIGFLTAAYLAEARTRLALEGQIELLEVDRRQPASEWQQTQAAASLRGIARRAIVARLVAESKAAANVRRYCSDEGSFTTAVARCSAACGTRSC